jgi:hypothetical protein
VELRLLKRNVVGRKKIRLIDVLRFLKGLDCVSNTIIAYVILMVIIHVTVAYFCKKENPSFFHKLLMHNIAFR